MKQTNHAVFLLGDPATEAQAHAELVKNVALNLLSRSEKFNKSDEDDDDEKPPTEKNGKPGIFSDEDEFHKELIKNLKKYSK